MIAVRRKLCEVAVVFGDEGDAVAGIPASEQAMLKSEQLQIMKPLVKDDLSQQVGL